MHAGDPPVITSQPQSLLNQIPGNNVQFSVAATAESGPNFQWRKDGEPLTEGTKYTGVDTATLTVNDIQFPEDEGLFSVVVSDDASISVTSDAATLDISMQR